MAFHRRRVPGGDLGEALYAIRERLNLNQAELAQLLACSQNMVSQYELARSRMGVSRLVALLRLAQGECERRPILAALEKEGIRESDLGAAAVNPSSTPQVLSASTHQAISEVEIFSDISPKTGPAERADSVEISTVPTK